ncbi:MAG: hypothetical protein ACE3JK_05265 [Sporolactobacillus sp.]
MQSKQGFRCEGLLILIGGMLLILAVVMHPPLVDPYNGVKALHGYRHAAMWMWDHIVMLLAMVLWLLGLIGSCLALPNDRSAAMSRQVFTVPLGLWILILCAELTALPILGRYAVQTNQAVAKIIWAAIFSFVLLAGYLAMACCWLGVILCSYAMKQNAGSGFPLYFSRLGLASGILGVLGIVLTCCFFNAGYILLPLTMGPPYLWTLWFGWKLISHH